MGSVSKMSSILPTLVLVLILFSDPGRGGGHEREDAPSSLPTSTAGKWGDDESRDRWVVKGSSVLLRCSSLQLLRSSMPPSLPLVATEQDRFNVTWLKNDQDVNNRRTRVTQEGHLKISKVLRRRGRLSSESDEGEYRCVVSGSRDDRFVVTGAPVFLHIADMGRNLKTSSTNMSELQGQSLRLKCQIASEPPAVFLWQRHQLPLPQDDRISLLDSGVLQIRNLKASDSGNYRCLATNVLLNRTKELEISVSVLTESATGEEADSTLLSPTFLSPDRNGPLTIAEDQNVTIECVVNGLPLPDTVWQFLAFDSGMEDWRKIQLSDRIKIIGEGNLFISSASVEDSGIYVCEAKSRNPQTQQEPYITQETTLQVVSAPVLIPPPRNITTLLAKTVRLNCSVQGSTSHSGGGAASHILWYKNGRPLETDARVKVKDRTQLIFINSITSDTGTYQCLVLNEAGFSTSWTHLLVNSSQDPLSPPHNLRYKNLTPTSAHILWDQVESPTNPVEAYSIHYNEIGTNSNELQQVSQNNSYILDNLKPHTNYSFAIRAYSTKASDLSEKATFRTLEDVPTAEPDFHVEAISPNSLLVSWSPLPPEKARGKVTAFKVQWQRRIKTYYNLDEVGPNTLEHLLTGLHPGKTYKVRVLARTTVGYNEGFDWPWKFVTMPELGHAPPGKQPMAPILDYVIVNSTSAPASASASASPSNGLAIKLMWSRPEEDLTPLNGYSLKYKRVSFSWSEPQNFSPTTTSYVITGLAADSYKIKLRGFNEYGEGAVATQSIHLKNKTSPMSHYDPPSIEHLEVVRESETIVRLTWKVIYSGKEQVAFYTIRQYMLLPGGTRAPVYTRSTAQSVTIDGLMPLSTYEFTVRAHISQKQFGLYSAPVRRNGLGTVSAESAGAPFDIQPRPKDPSTVEIDWKFPQLSDEAPSRFEIYYSRNTSDPVTNWAKEVVSGSTLKYELRGLISNKNYWIRMRGCSEFSCGPYSETVTACITAILPPGNVIQPYPIHFYLIVSAVAVFVLLLTCGVFWFYTLKIRPLNSSPNIFSCNGSNRAMNKQKIDGGSGSGSGSSDNGGGGSESIARDAEHNGIMSDIGRADRDYIPMLNRIHSDLPTAPLDTKGGYPNPRVNGFTNPRNGLIRGRELHYGPSLTSGKGEEMEECERLYTPETAKIPPEGDKIPHKILTAPPPPPPHLDSSSCADEDQIKDTDPLSNSCTKRPFVQRSPSSSSSQPQPLSTSPAVQ